MRWRFSLRLDAVVAAVFVLATVPLVAAIPSDAAPRAARARAASDEDRAYRLEDALTLRSLENPVWSADGESIVLSSYRSGGLNLWRIPVDLDGRAIGPMEQLTAGAGHDRVLEFPPAQ